MEITTKLKKKAYVQVVMAYVRYGYDISDMFHPTYKNIDVQKCIDVVNKLEATHEADDYYEFEQELTLERLNEF